MTRHGINIEKVRIEAFCKRNHITRFSFFGSILRDDFRPDSDIDVLVEFEVGATPSLMGMVSLEEELAGILGRKVDLRTSKELSRYFRQETIESAEVQYVQG
jgi:predicted nucleotidyltransferase